jgi:hypothetical protein
MLTKALFTSANLLSRILQNSDIETVANLPWPT